MRMAQGYARTMVVCCLALSGCAGVGAAMKYEPKVHLVRMPDDTYRVFEHPDGNKIMTTPSLGKSAGAGAVQGITFGLADVQPPEQRHEAAARKYLDDTGRANCRIVSGYLLVKPQYEFTIDCTQVVPTVASEPS